MGVVYKAEDIKLKRTVAVKFLPPDITSEGEARERFIREAQAAAALSHPHICTVHEINEEEKEPFIVMEYVDGQSLKEKIQKGPLDQAEALDIALQVAEGLEEAHGKGIIHRDIKPGNIMVTASGVVKILDLGLSKRLGLPESTVTHAGQFMGTPAYVAPEQARGDKDIDGRADIYALGATFFHMVTGEPPYRGETAIEIVTQHVLARVPDPQGVRLGIPDDVRRVIRRMMAKDPSARYPDCGALRPDLESLALGRSPRLAAVSSPLPAAAPAESAAEPEAPPPARHPVRRAFLGLVLLALLLVVIAAILDRQGVLRLPDSVRPYLDAWMTAARQLISAHR
jgi:serine/threonine-protein kinase